MVPYHVCGDCEINLGAADVEICRDGVERWVVDVGAERGET